MLMSKSRLEKFLYALYSLDSSDLPTPLSRIEELYKCWVTGEEALTFEPLSRVEKYLMSILGVYDVDSLPNPISRVEVLLYKLATGDDNLDDVKSFLSEHEELLAEIIRNGGVGGNINIEYVLYTLSTEHNTLYNTAEKPVKSAILKGQTLVNLSKVSSHDFTQGRTPIYDLAQPMKANTTYTIFINVTLTGGSGIFIRFGKNAEGDYTQYRNFTNVGLYKLTVTPDMEYTQFAPYIQLSDYNAGIYGKYDNLVIIEGDYTNQDIPYFEGMQSVKMPVLTTTGKNLFDMKDIDKDDFELDKYQTAYYGKEFILEPNTKYTIMAYLREDITDTSVWTVFNIVNNNSIVQVININKTGISGTNEIRQITFTTDSTGKVGYSIYSHNKSERSWLGNLPFDIQLEKGPTATSYEPYKSNILTVNEEVELRGIGDVKDELNLLTGELTRRIDESGNILSQEITESIDLSVVDQDGNNTKLSTFNDITHVTLSSEGLIPEAELEVATKNEEDLEDTSVYTVHTLSEEFNTLYNTAEKPIKSAILKGNTLVNVHPTNYVVAGSNNTFFLSKIIPKTMIKPNTRYFLRLYNTHQSIVRAYFKPCVNNIVNLISSDNKCAIFTTKSEFTENDFNNNKIHFYSSSGLALEDVKDTKVILCEYVDGMENWDIPYFEGMQSVKMPVLTTSNEDGTKSNILTTSEDVELRGIGDVKDELNLLTGELTRRIDESGNILSQEITESIDLSVVDQDGNSTKLSTFNDITHVTLSSEGLIPEDELEVAEKVPEVAARMLTISREQEVINTATNEQSENVDATMIATTEIYEGLL